MAEVIPGVSGGTIAFITGIYEQLINAIKAFDAELIRLLAKGKFKEAWSHIDGSFLVFLIAGMLGGIVIGVFGIVHLLENYPNHLWAFFFGLILASVVYVSREAGKWSPSMYVIALVAAGLAYAVTVLSPAESSASLPYTFLCGLIAISALILPGISGSFILLLLGMYTVIVPTVKNLLTGGSAEELLLIVVFGLGCILGLMTFSRVLSWLFKNHRQLTLSTLTGFMLGSLNKIWPWRIPTKWVDDAGNYLLPGQVTGIDPEALKIVSEENVLPASYTTGDPHTFAVILCGITGFAIVFALDRLFVPKAK